MAEKGVNVPFGIPATTVEEAVAAGATIGDEEVVIKSQILAGGRGLGTFTNGLKGGVHVIKTSEIGEYAGKMLGGTLVTKQSGPEGKPVNTLLLAKKMSLVRAPPPARGVRTRDRPPGVAHGHAAQRDRGVNAA